MGIVAHRGAVGGVEVHRGQASAAIEGSIANGGDAAGYGDGCQSSAVIEGIVTDGGDAAGYGDKGQAGAASEGTIANGDDGRWNRDASS